MHFDEDIDVRSDRVAHRARDLHGASDVILRDVRSPRAWKRVELQCREAALAHGFGRTGIILWRVHLVAPAVRVDPHARPAGTAEEIIDWLLRDLAGDVP